MKVPIRKTISGTEYWDTEAKRTLFVPNGKKPKFEVTKDPESTIGGVDLASGSDYTVVNDTPVVSDPNELTTDELKTYAENSGIKIPGNMKKEETIRNYILEELAAAADASDSE